MKIEELIKDLDAVTLIEFKEYLTKNITSLCCSKDANAKIIFNNKEAHTCEKCNNKLNKNGKTKNGVQKYICPICKKTCSETTGTIVSYSKMSFKIWENVINNLLDGFSLRRIAEENDISLLTSFRMRHKILLALNNFIESIELKNTMQSDEKYFNINLKGTKPLNMPRISKKRSSISSTYRGISHHKICVISAIDEFDNLILKIGGLGRGTTEMLEKNLGSKIKNIKELNADSASAYQQFCKAHNITLHAIPSGFHSDDIYNISEINNVHSQLEGWLKKFKGISTRHLQQYLDWFSYIFMMKKRFELRELKIKSYKTLILDNNYIKAENIFKINMPINLEEAYAEYS